jgi:Asp-tRNA(Asn)/Glu-tRNA(Gln) amidotransferase C subunit
MNIQEQIDEILGFFKEDCTYYAITGTIFKADIDTKNYKREDVEEQSFDQKDFANSKTGKTVKVFKTPFKSVFKVDKKNNPVDVWNSTKK